jgi:phosphotransferase system enzyme I (PtsI)
MRIFHGIAVSPGIAMGHAIILHTEDFIVPRITIDEADIPREITRFEDALTLTRSDIIKLRKKISEDMGHEHSEIFSAHLLILEDRTLIEDVIAAVKREKVTAEYAFTSILRRYFQAFSQMEDTYLKERIADIRDVGRRVLNQMQGSMRKTIADVEENSIVIAHDLAPSDTAAIKRDRVLGFVTEIGGPTSHTAIMARSLEIPAVVGIERIVREVATGQFVIIDGNHGLVLVDPNRETVEKFQLEQTRYYEYTRELDKLRDLAAETLDGHQVELSANIELPEEIPSVLSHGAEGIGLFRTEYIFMNRVGIPSENEQYEAYQNVADKMHPKPVIVRTLDLGGDKFASHLEVPSEMNPFLGWRAIRFCLARVDIFKTQLRAILRASYRKNLKIMYPLISNFEELRRANAILNEVKEELAQAAIPFDEKIPVGAMIEIPSAALTSDLLAREVDFFSIGTNDLIQYSLAVDRINEKIAYLYEPTHPAILKLIKITIDNAHQQSRWVGTCGEMCSDPAIALLLIGLGIDEISLSPIVIPTIKKLIRSVRMEDARKVAAEVMKHEEAREIREFLRARLEELAPNLTRAF